MQLITHRKAILWTLFPLLAASLVANGYKGRDLSDRDALGHRTCVELRRYDRLGYTGACYDPRGRPIEEAEGVVG